MSSQKSSSSAKLPLLASQSSIPVSLGKPSLRRRLEAYYSLVAPEQISSAGTWLTKFDAIAQKYGGSYEGERRLAKKLEAKYGSTVKLVLADSGMDKSSSSSSIQQMQTQQQQHVNTQNGGETMESCHQNDESYYNLTEDVINSGELDFTSIRFDPVSALRTSSEHAVRAANPFLEQCPRMDRIEVCRTILPFLDPCYRPSNRNRPVVTSDHLKKASTTSSTSFFSSLLETMDRQGPLGLLFQAFEGRKRLRVVIRYRHGIRGTITGHLIAFDKHFNLLLRDTLEVYTPPVITSERRYDTTKIEQELERRRHPCRQRHMNTILVRGDNVVLVYLAECEQSAFPETSRSPIASIHRKNGTNFEGKEKLGTLGTLLLAQNQNSHDTKRKFSKTFSK